MRIPDYCEAITAYRSFDAYANGLLAGEAFGEPWPPYAPMVARCGQLSGKGWKAHVEDGHWIAPPVLPCSCGVHALKTEQDMLDRLRDKFSGFLSGYGRAIPAGTVWGTVRLWGRIIEHETGYRAEFAYPSSLVCADAKLAAKVAALYGVPCVVGEAPKPVYIEHLQSFLGYLSPSWPMVSIGYDVVSIAPALTVAPTPIAAPSVAPLSAVGASSWQKRQRVRSPSAQQPIVDADWRPILRGVLYNNAS